MVEVGEHQNTSIHVTPAGALAQKTTATKHASHTAYPLSLEQQHVEETTRAAHRP